MNDLIVTNKCGLYLDLQKDQSLLFVFPGHQLPLLLLAEPGVKFLYVAINSQV